MGSRWKGKGSEAKALADPMSEIMQQLQYSLIQSETRGLLLGCSVLVEAGPEQANLLNRACFGRPIVTVEKDKLWFQLGLEEAFFLSHSFKCLQIVGEEDKCPKDNEELWEYIKSKRSNFPYFYKAYSHLRTKNWIVRSGSQYGVDFVAYRHHPALVHSDYAVLVLSEDDGYMNGRLRVWSDLHCTIRLCGSVAKTLLILTINKNGYNAVSPSCLRQYNVEERTFTRWSPERCREDRPVIRNGTDDIEAEQANSAIRKCTQLQLMIKNGKKIAASVPNDGCLNSVEEKDEELTADFGSKGQAVGRYSGSQVLGCEGITDVSSGSLQ